MVELYAILNYLYPTFFTTSAKFEDAFDITHNRIDPDVSDCLNLFILLFDVILILHIIVQKTQTLLKANKLLKLFMIRRLKEEVEKLMPKKIETKVSVHVLYPSIVHCGMVVLRILMMPHYFRFSVHCLRTKSSGIKAFS